MLQTQIARLKENVDKLQTESGLLRTKEQTAQDAARRLQRSLREARDEGSSALAREQESTRARRELEKSLEAAEAETKIARDDLRLALQRIDDLQSAIQGELDLDCSEKQQLKTATGIHKISFIFLILKAVNSDQKYYM